MKSDSWIYDEFSTVDLGDERRTARFLTTASLLASKPNESIGQACGSRATTKGAYRLFGSEHFESDDILSSHYLSTCRRIELKSTVLAIQDTTLIKYNGHLRTEGLGSLNREFTAGDHGLFLHPCLAITDKGIPLGIVAYKCWARDASTKGCRGERKKIRRSKTIDEKESMKWIECLRETKNNLENTRARIVNIADRECDLYPFMVEAIRNETSFLIRCKQNRSVLASESEAKNIEEVLLEAPILGYKQLTMREKGSRKERKVKLQIKSARVTLPVPTQTKSFDKVVEPIPICVSIVQAREIDSGSEKPISWTLITDIEVTDLEDSLKIINWYSLRWNIEVFFKILKSGCRVEDCRLGTADKLEKYIALMCIISFRIMFLSKISRERPSQKCVETLSQLEWQTLFMLNMKTKNIPKNPPTNLEAITMIAQLGGYLARKSDPPPGPIVLWRGLQKLLDAVETVEIMGGLLC